MKSNASSQAEKRKQIIAAVLGVAALVLVGNMVYSNFSDSAPATPRIAPPPPAAPAAKSAAGPAAQKVGTSSAALDPTLHMEPMLVTESLVYSGAGHNIFAPGSEPPPMAAPPKPVAPARTQTQVSAVTTPPPAPAKVIPPINLKFFGTATSATGSRKAFLLAGDDVFVASVGDIVQRKYRIVSINAQTIEVEDIPNANKQSLPLMK